MVLKNILLLLFFALFFSCKEQTEPSISQNTLTIQDDKYVVYKKIPKGDVRRYGVFPNKTINKTYFKNVLALATKGQPIHFPQGTYNTSLILNHAQNINITFNKAVFTGPVQIIGDKTNPSKNIMFKGNITTLTKFFTKHAKNIQIDSLIVASDSTKTTKRNLGCSIYAGTQNLNIEYLKIKDLGSGNSYYKFSHAALQVHGWNNNPKNISINNAIIEASDRHGVYLTGSGHTIQKLYINAVGLGDFDNIYGLEDAEVSEISNPTALWLNKCENTQIYHAIIDCKNSKAKFTLNFDEGASGNTTIIDTLDIINNTKPIPYTDHILTNVVVRYYNNSSGIN